MLVSEDEMISLLKDAKSVLFIEPKYKHKYIPLGLAKIAGFLKLKKIPFSFAREYSGQKVNLVCVASVFTYDEDKVLDTIKGIRFLNSSVKILIGGIYASMMTQRLENLLIKLGINNFYIFKNYSKILDMTKPYYGIDYDVEEPWSEFSAVFTARGCPNTCFYCAVPHLEKDAWINPVWQDILTDNQKYIMISDNNLTYYDRKHVINVLKFLEQSNKKILFNNGVDPKYVDDEIASLLGKLKWFSSGLKTSFDRLEEDGLFQDSIQKLIKYGVKKSAITAFVLFNFIDMPHEADYRMRECINLGIRPYPQAFSPLNQTSRKNAFVGKYWTKNLVSAFRYFWLMAGFNQKMVFDDFIKSSNSRNNNNNTFLNFS